MPIALRDASSLAPVFASGCLVLDAVALPDNESLIAELSGFRYTYDPKGRIKLEDKNVTRRRLGRSPDLADACLLGFTGATRSLGRYAYIGGRVVDFQTGKTRPLAWEDIDPPWQGSHIIDHRQKSPGVLAGPHSPEKPSQPDE